MTLFALLSIFAAFFISCILPVIFVVNMGKKQKNYVSAILTGILAGVIAVLMTRTLPTNGSTAQLVATCAITSVVYTITRLVALLVCGLVSKSPAQGYAIGVGQGMLVMFISTGLVYINNIIYGLMSFFGRLDGVLTAAGIPAEQIANMQLILTETPAFTYLLSAFEQYIIMTIAVLATAAMAHCQAKLKLPLGVLLAFSLDLVLRLLMRLLASGASITLQYVVLSLAAMVALTATIGLIIRKPTATHTQSTH